MTTKYFNLSDVHFDHKLWINELKFYEDEIGIYEHRLEDLVSKEYNREMLAGLERFQNQFIRHKEVIDELKHDINQQEHVLTKYAREHPLSMEEVYFFDHTDLKDRIDSFLHIYDDLKADFIKYLKKWM